MRRALLYAFASVTHLNPQVRLRGVPAHHDDDVRVLDVVQLFVIAPRPNVGARPATVGPCQTRAWLSIAVIPIARNTLCVR